MGETILRVAIDAGHGINTPGKRTPDGEREWSFNNAVALALVAELLRYKNVEILRLDDPTGKIDVPLTERTRKANAWCADLLISVHHNANKAVWGDWGGVETFVQTGTGGKSVEVAKAVQPRIVQAMGLCDRGVKQANLHMLRESKMPAILTEGGFMDSTTDIGALRDNTKLQAQGKAIADGIAEVYSLKLKEAEQVSAKTEDYKLTANDEKVIADLKRWGITDGKNPMRPVTQLYLWHVVHGALQAIKDGKVTQ
ncbi:N-acetylmuramoyl-L-alanine amidase [Bacillus sp. JJ1503]|uniref:N-acetylmuramoyl-L-alanine amidase n=1 Tax=Bacillus sp. JJ1503 TaxID=3122956 RepID=UPI002FFE3350